MKFLTSISPEIPLRLGLAGTFIYSGLNLITNPENWAWAYEAAFATLPIAVADYFAPFNPADVLRLQGIFELVFAVLLLAWFLPYKVIRVVALVIALELLAIIMLVGVNSLTFRDLGLLGAALALFFYSIRQYE